MREPCDGKLSRTVLRGAWRGDTPSLLSIGNKSEFFFDGLWRNTKIVETVSGSVTSTKQFVWDEEKVTPREARDGSSVITAQYFNYGQTIGGTTNKYSYTKDHLSSVQELTDGSGNVQAQYSYDAYGRMATKLESVSPDFRFAGYLHHGRSTLQLTKFRQYDAAIARWHQRDPLTQNLNAALQDYYPQASRFINWNAYGYVSNSPTIFSDPRGLFLTSTSCLPSPPCETEYCKCMRDCWRKWITHEFPTFLGVMWCQDGCKTKFPPPPPPPPPQNDDKDRGNGLSPEEQGQLDRMKNIENGPFDPNNPIQDIVDPNRS